MEEHEVIGRILALCDARGWTLYRLAKESGITYSTLCTMIHKTNAPSISTLIKICGGLGITLAQFFDQGDQRAELTQGEREVLDRWNRLSKENQMIARRHLDFLLYEQEERLAPALETV